MKATFLQRLLAYLVDAILVMIIVSFFAQVTMDSKESEELADRSQKLMEKYAQEDFDVEEAIEEYKAINYENDKFFSKLGDLSKDDVVYIKAKDGMKRVYSVTETREISANDVSCLNQNTKEKRQVTLITCTNVKNKRLVVKCEEFV